MIFTLSDKFAQLRKFTSSDKFTYSAHFSHSNNFTASNLFSASNAFTKSLSIETPDPGNAQEKGKNVGMIAKVVVAAIFIFRK